MFEITTAEKIIDTEIERQVGRRAARETPVMQTIYRAFLDRGGPVPVEDVMAAMPGMSRDAVATRLAALDEDDLIQIGHGSVEIAYPFAARPTPFVVRPAAGGERYACCAIDALGLAPMVGRCVEVVGECHHCAAPLAFAVTPDGPGPSGEGIMIWVGRRGEGERRALTGH
jgi:Alkylmercury lyase